jgi:hypothetical protein
MRAMKLALLVLALPLALYLALLALLWWGQERLIFQGTPLPPNFRFDVGPDVHERFIDVPGGRLSALPCSRPRAWSSSCTATPATWPAGSSTPTTTGAPTSTSS